jgi:signal peptidase II
MAAIGTMLLVAFDQLIKYLVVIKLKGNSPYVLISGVFQLEYLENRGAAFGILQNQRVFFYICAALIALVVLYFYHRVPMESRFLPLRLCAVFIISGAIGNVIDRIRLNYVVDFLYFKLIDFPIFNVADIYVTLSAIALILLVCVYYKEEDLERIFHRAG